MGGDGDIKDRIKMCQHLVTMLPERLAQPFWALNLPPPSAFMLVLSLHGAPSTPWDAPWTLISTLGRKEKTVLWPNSNAPMGRQGICHPVYFFSFQIHLVQTRAETGALQGPPHF